jgi:hypothetical protein
VCPFCGEMEWKGNNNMERRHRARVLNCVWSALVSLSHGARSGRLGSKTGIPQGLAAGRPGLPLGNSPLFHSPAFAHR